MTNVLTRAVGATVVVAVCSTGCAGPRDEPVHQQRHAKTRTSGVAARGAESESIERREAADPELTDELAVGTFAVEAKDGWFGGWDSIGVATSSESGDGQHTEYWLFPVDRLAVYRAPSMRLRHERLTSDHYIDDMPGFVVFAGEHLGMSTGDEYRLFVHGVAAANGHYQDDRTPTPSPGLASLPDLAPQLAVGTFAIKDAGEELVGMAMAWEVDGALNECWLLERDWSRPSSTNSQPVEISIDYERGPYSSWTVFRQEEMDRLDEFDTFLHEAIQRNP